jgi:hypothetical protein
MEIVKRANLKNDRDIKGMLLELATVEALKSIPLYVVKTSQFNQFYQQDVSIGPDVIFEFGDIGSKNALTGVIECKNVNMDFWVSEDWWKNRVHARFFPDYRGLDAYIVIMSHFMTSPVELRAKLKKSYKILSVGFQVIDQESYDKAVPIIAKDLYIVTESLKRKAKGLKK